MALDEFALIDRYFSHLTGGDDTVTCGIGDDAAIIAVPPGMELVVSTDTLVDGVHFLSGADPFDVGFKTLAVNLSDLAAMAAEPRWATLSLTLPEAEAAWLEGFTRGFAEMARQFGVSLVGGDLTRGPLAVTCQILGTVPAGAAVRRRGAAAGDDIHVTGHPGAAALALSRLRAGAAAAAIPADCLERLLRPRPRVRAGLLLRGTARAMIDISDGLAGDLQHILDAGGAGAEVDLARLPLPDFGATVSADQMRLLAVNGGDDYELCFTAPPSARDRIASIAEQAGCPITRIGCIVDGSGIAWLDESGNAVDLNAESYHHF